MNEPSLDRMFHAIADPTRRRILQALKALRPADQPDGLCARDLDKRIRVSQPTISHHMTILEKAGLVTAQKQAQWRWYKRNEEGIHHFIRAMKKSL
jgi:ArsR family transcriptional regulator, arsenate/arsenite/antimonite-responsive transcriptional repressor